MNPPNATRYVLVGSCIHAPGGGGHSPTFTVAAVPSLTPILEVERAADGGEEKVVNETTNLTPGVAIMFDGKLVAVVPDAAFETLKGVVSALSGGLIDNLRRNSSENQRKAALEDMIDTWLAANRKLPGL